MLQKLHTSGDPALEPLVITEDKVISVSRDHIMTPQVLANLFCNQLHRLRTTYIDTSSGKYFTYFNSTTWHCIHRWTEIFKCNLNLAKPLLQFPT